MLKDETGWDTMEIAQALGNRQETIIDWLDMAESPIGKMTSPKVKGSAFIETKTIKDPKPRLLQRGREVSLAK